MLAVGAAPGSGRLRAAAGASSAVATLASVKWETRDRALELLLRHPGWSDRRVARELAARGHPVSHVSVSAWRREAGYAPALKQVGEVTRRQRIA